VCKFTWRVSVFGIDCKLKSLWIDLGLFELLLQFALQGFGAFLTFSNGLLVIDIQEGSWLVVEGFLDGGGSSDGLLKLWNLNLGLGLSLTKLLLLHGGWSGGLEDGVVSDSRLASNVRYL